MTVRGGTPVSFPRFSTPVHEVGATRVRTYECCICHTVGMWGESWSWFGSENDLDGGYGNAKPGVIDVFCGEECRRKHEARR